MTLIFVTDIYGRRSRIAAEDLASGRVMLPLRLADGRKKIASKHKWNNGSPLMLHRDNIAAGKAVHI